MIIPRHIFEEYNGANFADAPANLQAIFMRMNRQPYRAGEVVIKQGDDGDYFYAIVQ